MELIIEDYNDSADGKTTFRKPSSDAANGKYRRRSPTGSRSSDESPKHNCSTSPTSKGDVYGKRDGEDRQRIMSDRSDLEKKSSRDDTYKSSDRHSRHRVDRHGEGSNHSRYANEDDREYRRSSGYSSRESRRGVHSDHMRDEGESGRSRNYVRDMDKKTRNRDNCLAYKSKDSDKESLYDEHHRHKGNDLHTERSGSGRRSFSKYEETESDTKEVIREKSSRDYRSKSMRTHEELRGHRHGSSSRKDDSGARWYNTDKSDQMGSKGQNVSTGDIQNDKQKSPAKKSKFSSMANWEQSSTLNQAMDIGDKVIAGQVSVNEAAGNMNAAKFAAIRAAELVNKNLTGVGSVASTTEQKKKLLWGNKKKTTTDEPAHHWDATLFGDRERQEKFNKLMGVKGDVKMEQKSGTQGAEKQRELQLDLEKQYTAGLRRRDGRTVGLGL